MTLCILCISAGWHGASRRQGCRAVQGRDVDAWGRDRATWGRDGAAGCSGSPQVHGVLLPWGILLLAPGWGAAWAAPALCWLQGRRELPAPPLPQPMFGPWLQQGHKRQRGEGAGTSLTASGPPCRGRPEELPPGLGLGASA